MLFLDNTANLIIDLTGGLLAVVARPVRLAVLQKHGLALLVKALLTERVAHAVGFDHTPGRIRCLEQIVPGPGRNLLVNQLFGHPTAEEHRNFVFQLGLGHEKPIFARQLEGIAQGRDPARNNRDLLHFIRPR